MGALLRPFFRGLPVPASRQELDPFFREVFAPLQGSLDRWFPAAAGSPRLNVWEEGDVYFAEAEVPGLKSEDLELSVVGNELTIKGRRDTASEEGTTFHRRERGFGEFVRAIKLPVEVDSAQVSATLVNGVLTVRLPKAEAAKPRKISVAQN